MSDKGKTILQPVGAASSRLTEPMDDGILAEGSRFGAYVVGACIGRGGMARIYRAEHEGLQRSVALKVLLGSVTRDPKRHERFLREGRIAAAVKHPHVVNIFDVGVHGRTPYLVMELLEGQDLEARMRAEGVLQEATVIELLLPIVAGLAAVHDAGVVHRDLKPGNIFLSRGRGGQSEPKLLDFGISKAAESEEPRLTTAEGLLMGTPLYMSPEAIAGGEMTALSDQYSLGVVLYECCTGQNPFTADTLAETVHRVATGEFAPAAVHNPALSRRMGELIGRAMSLVPEQRFADVRELGRELLLLAGQRTRITWSINFGTAAPRRGVDAADADIATRSAPSSAARSKPSSAGALLLGGVLFGAALAVAWSSRSPGTPATVSARAVEVELPRASGPSPVFKAQTEPEVVIEQLAVEHAATSAPKEAEESLGAPKRSTRSMARVRREAAARAQRASREQEWVQPEHAPARPSKLETSPAMGTNNAPIFE